MHQNLTDDHAVIRTLTLYPIKGCRGVSVESAPLDAQGLQHDRRWMLVGLEPGTFYTQRELPQLACVLPQVNTAGDALTVNAPGMVPLVLPLWPDEALQTRQATVWGFTGEARDEGEIAARWFSEALQTPCRLVRTPQNFVRRVGPKYQTDNRVGFADACPVLLASESSLEDLNTRLAQRGHVPVPMSRFRANIIVRGLPAWGEDAVSSWRVNDAELTLQTAGPCARCAVVTIDQDAGIKTGAEPLATLADFRRDANGKVRFGSYLLPNQSGPDVVLRIGDVLRPI